MIIRICRLRVARLKLARFIAGRGSRTAHSFITGKHHGSVSIFIPYSGRSSEHRVVHFSAVEDMLHNAFKFLERKAKKWWARWVAVRRQKNPSIQDVWDLYGEAQQIILADLDQSEAIRLFLLQDLRDRYNSLYPRQMLGPRRGWRRLRLSTNSEKRNRQNTNV